MHTTFDHYYLTRKVTISEPHNGSHYALEIVTILVTFLPIRCDYFITHHRLARLQQQQRPDDF